VTNVLVAEDDLMIADMIEETLLSAGYGVCGIARTVSEAVRLCQLQRPDLAIIDIKLADGGLGTEIVEQLRDGPRIGVLYASGNTALIGEETVGDAYLTKPYKGTDLMRALTLVEQIVSNGVATQPFPRGFHLLRENVAGSEKRPQLSEPPVTDLVVQNATLRRQQAALAGFGSFALRQTDLLTILTEAAKLCAEGLNVPFCKVCRYREDQNDLLIEAGFGWHVGVVGHVVSRADESSPQGRAFITGHPAICNDLRTATNFQLPPFYAAHGIVSTIDVIIKGDSKPYGVLEIDNNQQHDYDEHDIDFLTGFANVLAEAVATSTRLSVLNATIAEKDRLLDQKKVLAEKLQHQVRNNIQLVNDMISTQLDSTKGIASQRGLRTIARRVATLAQVYDNLLGSEMTRMTDFGTYTKSLCDDIAEVQASAITLTCTYEPLVLDLDTVAALGIVLAELITNSYNHAFPAGSGAIAVSLCANVRNMARVTISDNGKGFKPMFGSKRHGLGLVRQLIKQVGGSLVVKSDLGTTWVIRFPFAPPLNDAGYTSTP
jgi:two-component sensor histidine kinase/DNA-binding response OmpR family regulator